MATKIGFLRDEFLRIGCVPPRNPLEPRLYVGWHFTEILVSGLQEETFDYDLLCHVLKGIPNGVGEKYFWATVKEVDFEGLADLFNQGILKPVR